jgi:hypothetical protein
MFPMYALMSAFHSAPWLRLIVRQRNIARSAAKQAAGRGGGFS